MGVVLPPAYMLYALSAKALSLTKSLSCMVVW